MGREALPLHGADRPAYLEWAVDAFLLTTAVARDEIQIHTHIEIEARIRRALGVFRTDQFWVNPDCGLKTRSWEEVRPALRQMVIAARRVREAESRERGADPERSAAGRK
ncbi:MAG: hypothetical protein ACM336_12470 [Acidobacteriota bacterium]